ncbi:hypothetical protein MSAN_00012200 [Mycena sanguinolenta]|uniref:Uncharacterized protein n=1 Tax=Mycena sanguinolenta TaxID=230812 RepID=A0A8H6ZFK1_9AGAR|nr:hypothetical protein MSAN_00012200 [Mycena sanguinolenta]
MAMKRKFADDSDAASCPTNAKQLKLVPWPNYQPDEDSCMTEAEPLYSEHRFPSNASSTSSGSDSPSSSSPAYPTFDLYPLPFFGPDGNVDPNSHSFAHYAAQQPPSPPVGLLQPSGAFTHHGSGCSQIPKLKVACASGLNGQRTMWSFCEQCGAISMVDDGSSS